MKIPEQQFVFRKKLLVIALLLTVGAAYAEDEDVEQLTKNESTVSVGVGGFSGNSKDRSIFTQYSGLSNNGGGKTYIPLLDFSITKLNQTGLWTKLEGHNLGVNEREFSVMQNQQGNWKYSLEYNEITHNEIRTINTGLQGAGTSTPTVTSLTGGTGTGADLHLNLQREALTVGAEKWLTANLLFEANFKNETKTGSRLSGEGLMCSNGGFPSRYPCGGNGLGTIGGAILMLPEPVNTTTKQIDARLNYSDSKFLVSGGYYGTYFTNANGSLNPTLSGNPLYASNLSGTSPFTPSAPGLASYLTAPIALQPDNQSQQFYVSGNYAFTPTTRSTFKYAYTHATQNENFSNMGLSGAAAGASSLGGAVNTNLLQFGLTARPLSKLTLLGNVRYEDRDDKTPQALYNLTVPFATPPSPLTVPQQYSNNYSRSLRKLNGKLEAAYQLPGNYRATLGIDYATIHRAAPPSPTSLAATDMGLAVGGMRENTRETGYRAELRKVLSDTVNGAVSYVYSQRTGDNWTMYSLSGTLPSTMLDRKRDKVKLLTDWMPTRLLSLQFILESGRDSYTGPNNAGMRDTKMDSYGIDATLNLNDFWKLTGYVNQSDQTLHVSHITLDELNDLNTTLVLGLVGKINSQLDVGGNVSYVSDVNRYNLSGGTLPNVTYRSTNLKLFGKYALQKNGDVRVDFVHQSASLNEWAWGYGQGFTYSDNTTVSMQPNQSVSFLGASYIYKFR